MPRPLLATIALVAAATSGAAGAPAADPAPSSTVTNSTSLTTPEIAAHMRALAIKKRDALTRSYPELARPDTDDIPALGPCKRPDGALRTAITSTIQAWLARQPGMPKDIEPGEIRMGCVEAAGIVVDVQADTLIRPDRQGHWWILRIADQAVDVLAHEVGTALDDFMEWAAENTLHTVGLVDLDRDGTLDVIAGLDSHEGGAFAHHATISTILSRTHRTVAVAEFDDAAALARGQRHRPGDPVVLAIYERGHDQAPARVFYRCLDTRPELLRCDATRKARQLDAAWDTITSWTGGGAPSVPDADLLADQLTALDAPADERTAILSSAVATHAGTGLARQISRFLHPEDDRTNAEREAAQHAEAVAWNTRLRDALGARSCSLTDAAKTGALQDRLRAWGESHTPTGNAACAPSSGCQMATRFEIAGGCTGARGSFYELTWGPSNSSYGVHRHAVVFVGGSTVTPVRDFVAVGDDSPPPASGEFVDPGFVVRFSRQGNAAAAIVVDKGATAVIDGVVAGSLPEEPSFFYAGPGVVSEVVVAAHSADREEYWRIGRGGFVRLGAIGWDQTAPGASDAPPRILVDRELANRARNRLAMDWSSPDTLSQLRDARSRADLAAALAVLKADRSLIAAVKAGI